MASILKRYCNTRADIEYLFLLFIREQLVSRGIIYIWGEMLSYNCRTVPIIRTSTKYRYKVQLKD